MKTSVEIDEVKLKTAKRLSQVPTLKEIIDLALTAYISQLKRKSLANVLGAGMISGSVSQMRRQRRGRTG